MPHGVKSGRTDPPLSINLIRPHNGVAKAKLLNMHNKQLIAERQVALSGRRTQLLVAVCEGAAFVAHFMLRVAGVCRLLASNRRTLRRFMR
jgi:hypothetical protein